MALGALAQRQRLFDAGVAEFQYSNLFKCVYDCVRFPESHCFLCA